MMDRENLELLTDVIRAAWGAPSDGELSARLDTQALRSLYEVAKEYDMSHMVGYVLERMGRTTTPMEQEFIRLYMFAVFRCERSAQELDAVSRTLGGRGIDHLPLKGAVLREWYPARWMRTSTDVDILVPKDQLLAAREALQSELGYIFDQASDHDLAFYTPGGDHFELHFSLIEDGVVNRADEPLRGVWKYTVPCPEYPHRYELSPEMFYYYHIAHMAKHFVQGGCGIRPFLDIWVMLSQLSLDREACERLLETGGLVHFAREAEHLSGVWFGGQEHTDVTLGMQSFLLSGGEFGTYENRAAVAQNKTGGKMRYALSRIWLDYRQMCVFYPSLKGRAYLLPVYEVWRWLRLLFGGGAKRSIAELKANASVTEEQRNQTARLLEKLGL